MPIASGNVTTVEVREANAAIAMQVGSTKMLNNAAGAGIAILTAEGRGVVITKVA